MQSPSMLLGMIRANKWGVGGGGLTLPEFEIVKAIEIILVLHSKLIYTYNSKQF